MGRSFHGNLLIVLLAIAAADSARSAEATISALVVGQKGGSVTAMLVNDVKAAIVRQQQPSAVRVKLLLKNRRCANWGQLISGYTDWKDAVRQNCSEGSPAKSGYSQVSFTAIASGVGLSISDLTIGSDRAFADLLADIRAELAAPDPRPPLLVWFLGFYPHQLGRPYESKVSRDFAYEPSEVITAEPAGTVMERDVVRRYDSQAPTLYEVLSPQAQIFETLFVPVWQSSQTDSEESAALLELYHQRNGFSVVNKSGDGLDAVEYQLSQLLPRLVLITAKYRRSGYVRAMEKLNLLEVEFRQLKVRGWRKLIRPVQIRP
jgi:hypothetical protein